mmetsp:Transcript_16388/g.41659  ORF Transcript_16388/g.41659 Transcript_16388/m.41659 type:complete len:216 (-) Transcript_16388:368-1015(-)
MREMVQCQPSRRRLFRTVAPEPILFIFWCLPNSMFPLFFHFNLISVWLPRSRGQQKNTRLPLKVLLNLCAWRASMAVLHDPLRTKTFYAYAYAYVPTLVRAASLFVYSGQVDRNVMYQLRSSVHQLLRSVRRGVSDPESFFLSIRALRLHCALVPRSHRALSTERIQARWRASGHFACRLDCGMVHVWTGASARSNRASAMRGAICKRKRLVKGR